MRKEPAAGLRPTSPTTSICIKKKWHWHDLDSLMEELGTVEMPDLARMAKLPAVLKLTVKGPAAGVEPTKFYKKRWSAA